jgi:hypothetical protein
MLARMLHTQMLAATMQSTSFADASNCSSLSTCNHQVERVCNQDTMSPSMQANDKSKKKQTKKKHLAPVPALTIHVDQHKGAMVCNDAAPLCIQRLQLVGCKVGPPPRRQW